MAPPSMCSCSEGRSDIHLALDHLGQGLLIVDRQGRLGEEHSKTMADWLGAPTPGELLWSYLSTLAIAPALEVGWSAIVDGVLPLELAIDQLPKTFFKEGRTYEMLVKPVLYRDGEVERLLVLLSDVTASIAQARAMAGQRDLASALAGLARDRSGFLSQLEEADHLVHRIAAATHLSADLKRALHTLKGNAAILGFESLAQCCHRLEGYIAEVDELPTPSDRRALREAWLAIFVPLEALYGDRATNVVVERRELARLKRAIESGETKSKLLESVRTLAYEPAGKRLARLANWVRRAAAAEGKPEPWVDVDDAGLRFDEETWEPFWSACVHLVRNAIAHGIELPEERRSRGKPDVGRLSIRCVAAHGELFIVFEDDGRGIDWGRVRQLARERGVPCGTQDDLVEVLFHDGLSTRGAADELSGRGVGLGAVRAAVRALGGGIAITSEIGKGTEVRASFPLSAVGHSVAQLSRSFRTADDKSCEMRASETPSKLPISRSVRSSP